MEVLQNSIPVIEWQEILEDDREGEALKVSISNEIMEMVNSIRSMLDSMDDGEISISAYDTAWLALVEDIHGSGAPQFPSTLQWIVHNQLPDGSWGDRYIFSAYDRIISTLACVVALKSWNIHPERCEKGMSFLLGNIGKLKNENAEHMTIGFELSFPSLIDMARRIDLEVPDDSPVLEDIYAKRNLKLTRIPKDLIHIVPTTILYSLEGMPGLDWEKLLKLQFPEGSFLFSPSSTAFALMHTKDKNCLKYLQKIVERFNGVPCVYPVDLFEHIWASDRLERLGISRYFQSEIKECLNYVYRNWTEHGICWARNSGGVYDIDDTSMGFRVLRLHGYEVSADVFQQFENGGEFFCCAGQSDQAITGMFNLYRASQVLFPGEQILEEAKTFSSRFLREKQTSNKLVDKWIITKDLPGEVGYALDVPWYASLPRIETRFYVEQYGGSDDVWIGKTLYRMGYVNNNTYLELAKLDFNNCQALHQLEWISIQGWYTECNLRDFGVNRETLLLTYFVAAASIFEPERSKERLAWARTAVLVEAISYFFQYGDCSVEQRRAFLHDFNSSSSSSDNNNRRRCLKRTIHGLVEALLGTVNNLSSDALTTHSMDIRYHLQCAWETWLFTWVGEEEEDRNHEETELLVHTINLCSGYLLSEELLSHPHYERLSLLTNRVSHQLRCVSKLKEDGKGNYGTNMGSIDTFSIESNMQELVESVLQNSDGIDRNIKQTFLIVAKSFYYTAYCTPDNINLHIVKVLFERVV
ncbi:hypothetical protein HHK36_012641 [Tetracentron sinense]|uniref:Uncharacterized protein n=1 Tax=Tetracentron sinense TaxID=13715 RepID=A0A834Z9N1_TETSI|nr:hypothetical protein HHK36_012641 [Tetracentron sinense]